MPALWTGIEVSSQSCGAALLDGAEGLELLVVKTRFVSVQKAAALRAENIGHLHGRPAHCGLRSLRESGTWAGLAVMI